MALSLDNLSATLGNGITVELVSRTASYQATLAALEVFTPTPQGTATPTVGLDYSDNGGTTWTPISGAGSLTLDRWGKTQFQWTVPTAAAEGGNYLIRARSTASTGEITDVSNGKFVVANAGHDYYVNDSQLAGDQYTTAIGSNYGSGKSPDQPLASLTAMLKAYTFEPGDVIHVDTGNYTVIRPSSSAPFTPACALKDRRRG